MSKTALSQQVKVHNVLTPTVDGYNGDPNTDRVSMANYGAMAFILSQEDGGGATGKAVVTLEASSDNAGTGAEAIAYCLRRNIGGGAAVDELAAAEAITSAGFDTDGGVTGLYIIEVLDDSLPDGKPFLSLKLTESTDDPMTVHCVAQASVARHQGSTLRSMV